VKIDIGMYPMDDDDRPTDDQLMVRVRIERDEALNASDWTQTLDAPLTDAKKAEWATYRQSLRDLPASISVDLIVDFPDLPS
jgi:hypothetical protein